MSSPPVQLMHLLCPALPVPPSWFPGHMNRFTKQLPSMLSRTHVVIEVRDARLPLTSINRNLQDMLREWREKARMSNRMCQHVILLNKADRIPEWGITPFLSVMKDKYPEQDFHFTSLKETADLKRIYRILSDLGKHHRWFEGMNVLIVGMPNVGKSSLLNALRNTGIKGRTPKAVRTGANPGVTVSLSNRIKILEDPLVYAFDSPGMMLPFLGHGPAGAERGAKLALIAGIKEGLYQTETLAEYLLYKLNILNSISPNYLSVLPSGSKPTADVWEFLSLLAQRMGMLAGRGEYDLQRAATFFIDWWRNKGGLAEHSDERSFGWGFDFQWSVPAGGKRDLRKLMEMSLAQFDAQAQLEEEEGNMISDTQKEKTAVEERKKLKLKKLMDQDKDQRSRRLFTKPQRRR